MKVKYEATSEKPMSAADAMPSDAANDRAANHPVPGDRWTEMYSAWFHVDEVGDDVLVRLYVGPCDIRPEEAKQEFRIPVGEFPEWIKRQGSYVGNADWVRQVGTNSGPRSPFG